MVELIVVGEGETEERFVVDVLAPMLALREIYATPRRIESSRGHRGGGLNLERVKRFVKNTLHERADTHVTTMFDLYALDPSFRGVTESRGHAPSARARHIEELLREDVVAHAQCERPERFFPHIQPHEFEALLFSDVSELCQTEPDWHEHRNALSAIRNGVESPEHINDSPQTAPSKRLAVLRPHYRKTRHGPAAAAKIGLDRIREACPHFGRWLDRLTALQPI